MMNADRDQSKNRTRIIRVIQWLIQDNRQVLPDPTTLQICFLRFCDHGSKLNQWAPADTDLKTCSIISFPITNIPPHLDISTFEHNCMSSPLEGSYTQLQISGKLNPGKRKRQQAMQCVRLKSHHIVVDFEFHKLASVCSLPLKVRTAACNITDQTQETKRVVTPGLGIVQD